MCSNFEKIGKLKYQIADLDVEIAHHEIDLSTITSAKQLAELTNRRNVLFIRRDALRTELLTLSADAHMKSQEAQSAQIKHHTETMRQGWISIALSTALALFAKLIARLFG